MINRQKIIMKYRKKKNVNSEMMIACMVACLIITAAPDDNYSVHYCTRYTHTDISYKQLVSLLVCDTLS